MQILTTTGYSTESYGAWMNTVMESSPSEWVLFYDHDIFLANPNWFSILQAAITAEPTAGLFTCMTNRIGNPQQRQPGVDNDNDDIMYHIKIAKDVDKGLLLTEAVRPISGLMMLTSKTAWEMTDGFREKGIIGVDNNYHWKITRAGLKTYIINNLYVYHKYRKQGSSTLLV